MISEAALEALKGFVPSENIRLGERMSQHTTFRIGGEADCFIELENKEQLLKVQKYLTAIEEPFFILGNGSNILVSDEGYRGVILQIGRKMSQIRVEGSRMIAGAGALLSQVAKAALAHGLTGLEFACGIPGTVGGGVVMNAGAYGGEMSQVVAEVTVTSRDGEVLILDNESMEFGYRTSTIKNHPFVVTEAAFELEGGDRQLIQEKMEEETGKLLSE